MATISPGNISRLGILTKGDSVSYPITTSSRETIGFSETIPSDNSKAPCSLGAPKPIYGIDGFSDNKISYESAKLNRFLQEGIGSGHCTYYLR